MTKLEKTFAYLLIVFIALITAYLFYTEQLGTTPFMAGKVAITVIAGLIFSLFAIHRPNSIIFKKELYK